MRPGGIGLGQVALHNLEAGSMELVCVRENQLWSGEHQIAQGYSQQLH